MNKVSALVNAMKGVKKLSYTFLNWYKLQLRQTYKISSDSESTKKFHAI